MQILEVIHYDFRGNILFNEKNIHNLLHNDGEDYLLQAAFTGGQVSTVIPDNYYLGLDNRSVVQETDTMDDLTGEPSSGGYERQPVSSSGDFVITFQDDHFVATSPIVAFRSVASSWGPVSNLFLTDKVDNSGFLISTAVLSTPLTVDIGDTVTMRIGMQLKDCPDST